MLAVVPAAVVVHALADNTEADSRAGLGRVAFGGPLGWLTQDQSSLDPRFPYRASVLSPWEHPLGVAVLPLLVDVGVVATVLAVMLVARWLAFRAVRAHESHQNP